MESRKDHAHLIQRLSRQMSADMIVEMKDYLLSRRSIEKRDCEELNRLHLIIDHLERLAVIKISEKEGYKLLIETFEEMNQHALANEVQRHQEKFCRDGDDSSSREAEPTTSEQSARELPKSGDAAAKDQFQELLSQLASKNETIECLEKEKEELRDELSDLKKMGVAKSEDVNEMRREISNLRGQSRGLQSDLDSSREEIHQLRSQVEEYKRNLTTKEKDYKRLQEELDPTKKEKTELQKVLETTKKEKTELQKVLQTFTTKNTELQKELDTTKKKLEEQVQEKGVQGAVGATADIQRYQGQEGVQLAKGRRDIERCREVFIKEYGTNIRSIVNLGDRFAVTYCDQSFTKVEGVDIFNISGVNMVKQQTLKDNIEGLTHLAVTPDKGTLVAVCDEGRGGPYTIRQFDPVRGGFIRSTPQFEVDGGVQRFDVCDGQQFVILHGGYADKVTFVNEEGSVVLTEKVKSSNFISCGGSHVFLSRGEHYVDVYEITEDRHLKHIATSQHFDRVSDVSATAAGEVTVACLRDWRYCLGRSTFKDNKFSEWKYKQVDSRRQVFVSVGGDHVVVVGWDNIYNDRRRILRVFKEKV